jgi:hypothetical protein
MQQPADAKVAERKTRVFVSYARKDGEAFAIRLRERLKDAAPDVNPWLDHYEMVGGRGWWVQITSAIDAARALVLVMTPAAFRSEVVRREWQYARQHGVPVFPVKGVADAQIDYAALPAWMSKSHLYDPEDQKQSGAPSSATLNLLRSSPAFRLWPPTCRTGSCRGRPSSTASCPSCCTGSGTPRSPSRPPSRGPAGSARRRWHPRDKRLKTHGVTGASGIAGRVGMLLDGLGLVVALIDHDSRGFSRQAIELAKIGGEENGANVGDVKTIAGFCDNHFLGNEPFRDRPAVVRKR